MNWLKQSTAATVPIGPFLDATDGVTAETALTIAQADIRLSKNGGAFAQSSNTAGATHMENGYYSVPLDTTDTGTLGRLRLAVSESGALPVWQDFIVLPANVYDSLVSGSDKLQVDAVEISSDSGAADNAESFFDGTGYAGTNNVIPTVTTLTNKTGFSLSASQSFDNAGQTTKYAVTLAAADAPQLAGFGTVTYVAAGGSTKATIEAASAGTLVVLGPGEHALGNAGIAVPAGVAIRGCGVGVTRVTSTSVSATVLAFGAGCAAEALTATGQAVASAAGGLTLRDVEFRGTGDALSLTGAGGYVTVERSWLTSGHDVMLINGDWDVRLREVHMDANAVGQDGGSVIVHSGGVTQVRGERLSILMRGANLTGNGILAETDATVDLYDSSISVTVGYAINNLGGTVRTTDCEYDRSLTNGTITDVLTPLRPTVAGRTLNVNASGHVERVTLVDTTTTNTDMRGTDNAVLATTFTTFRTAYTDTRAGYMDKLNVAGTLAHTGNADSFKADVSGLLTAAGYTAPPSAASIADAVLDEALSGHATAGTAGAALTTISTEVQKVPRQGQTYKHRNTGTNAEADVIIEAAG